MFKYAMSCATALFLMGGAVSAQTTPPQDLTAPLVAPPAGTLSTSDTRRTIDGNGTETDSSRTTYRNQAGVADDVHTTTTTHPAPMSTTSTSTTTTTTR
jgi:hypothetical protein